MKFNMGNTTLGDLVKQTSSSHTDLAGLVRKFIAAAEPLEKDMDGAGKRAFDTFKAHSDEIGNDLQNSLAMVNRGQAGMDTAFQQGDQQAADNATRNSAGANYDGARFASQA